MKAKKYKSTYPLLSKMTFKLEAKQMKVYKNDVKHITKLSKAHQSTMNENHGLNMNS